MNAQLNPQAESNMHVLEEIQTMALPFDTPRFRHYPGMKLGQMVQVAFFGQQLAALASQVLRHDNAHQRQWLITSPAYQHLPSAANLLARHVTQQLQQQGFPVELVEMRFDPAHVLIRSQEEFKRLADYSKCNVQQRIAQRQLPQPLLHSDQLAARFSDHPVLIINDINVTGTQQRFMQQMLDEFQASACHWLYIFNVEKSFAQAHPEVENKINNSQFADQDSYANVLADSQTQHTAICISRLFNQEIDAFRHVLSKLPNAVCEHLHRLALAECRYNSPLFDEKMNLLAHRPTLLHTL